MPNGDQDASERGDPRTVREKIADALIPPHRFLLRAAYLLGRDEVLLRFLSIPEYDGCVSQHSSASLVQERPGELLHFAPHHLR